MQRRNEATLGVARMPPNRQLLLTALDGNGGLAPFVRRVLVDAPQQNCGR